MKEIALKDSGTASGGHAGDGPRLAYLPALDGIRAVAVIAVLLYHGEQRWLPGGFLGVEVFFVLSGYLITSLLLSEWRQRDRISLKGFWLRRARRLLPAVFLLLLTTLAFAVIFLPQEVAGLRSDALASMGYVTNWYLVFSHKSYFEAIGRPSLLRHLWSLAVEEQFYLLWPLLFTLLMRRGSPRRAAPIVLLGAVASTALMALLYRPDVDPSRVYYGTDTRAAGFLIGAALAFVWSPKQAAARSIAPWLIEGIGALALAALCAFFALVGEFDPFLYRGGFAVLALATALLIAAVVHPRARLLSGGLGWAPLRWIGLRSYGIYLWHWPVYMVTRPQLDVTLTGLPLLALRLIATGVLAELSYRFIETPIRSGGLGRAWHTFREAQGLQRRWLGLRWAGGVAALVLVIAALAGPVVSAQPPPPPAYLAVASIDTLKDEGGRMKDEGGRMKDEATPTLGPVSDRATVTPPLEPVSDRATATPPLEPVSDRATATSPLEPISDRAPVTPAPSPTPAATATPSPIVLPAMTLTGTMSSPPGSTPVGGPALVAGRITAFGDSVMLGAVEALTTTFPGLDFTAALGRQPWDAAAMLRERREAGELGALVVIHIGNNGIFSAKNLADIMDVLADAQRVVFINVRVPRPWESETNKTLAEGVKRYPNAVLVDWRAATADRPEIFWGDGMHVRREGAQFYVELITAALKTTPAPNGRPVQ